MSEAIDLFVDRPVPSAPYPLNRTGDKLHHAGRIEITHISKSYGAFKALDDVSLTIEPGTVTVILGPSGSGKSTLLRTINHLERVDEGFIQIDGEYVGYRRKGDRLYELKEKPFSSSASTAATFSRTLTCSRT